MHHKDQIKIHDRLGNLKICTKEGHAKEHCYTHRWLMAGDCSFCGLYFCKLFRGIKSKFGERKYHYCSKSCGRLFYGKLSKELC